MEHMIEVSHVKRYYKVAKREQGMGNSIRHLFKRKYEIKRAVDDVSFTIKKGEIVGFIGPNGAGKSTTVKMLSGILYPDDGSVKIDGFIPYKQRKQYVKNIGVVFGQKSQLNWDLPLIESFELMRYIYKIPMDLYEENLHQFTELLDMEDFLYQPVRQLSLGQRMRGDIVAALLHSPKIVFFDEPTIGLDVVAKEKIRNFIRYMNQKNDTTIIFTTHDMQDIEKICERLIIIDSGKKIYDGSIQDIKNRYTSIKNIELILEDGRKEMRMTYKMVATNFVIALGLSQAFTFNEMFMQDKIKDGSITNEFLKPVSFKLRMLSENIGEGLFKVVFHFFPALILTCLYTDICMPKSFANLVLMLLSMMLGYLVLWLISFIVQTWSFWLFSVWGIVTIKNVFINILSGSLLPLWFMPGPLKTIISCTPFESIYFTPVRIYLGQLSGMDIFKAMMIQCGWILVLYLAGNIFWKQGVKKLVVQGG